MSRTPRSTKRPTFQDIVTECRRRCDRNLFRTARLASSAAKVARGRSREALYRVKHRALGGLIDRGRAAVRPDHVRCPGLLSVEVAGEGRLHTHERWMEAATW